MSIPSDLPSQMADLYRRIAELERRVQNQRRTGKVAEVDYDKKLARVELTKDADGQPFLGPWMPWKVPGAGAVSFNIPPSVGEQVEVTSESGDIADGVIGGSIRSDSNDIPPAKAGEVHIKTGSTYLLITPTKFEHRADEQILKGKSYKMVKG